MIEAARAAGLGRALELMAAGDWAQAEAQSLAALERTPEDPRALFCLGLVALHGQQPVRAEELLVRSLRQDPDYAYAHLNLGVARSALAHPGEAAACFAQAARLAPGLAEAWQLRGGALLDLQLPAEALDCYEQALRLRPGWPEAIGGRILALRALLAQGQAADVLLACERLIAGAPTDAQAFTLRGNAQLALERHAEAVASYDLALGLEPASVEAHNNRGLALLALNRPAEAHVALEIALRHEPHSHEAHANRGLALLALNRAADALAALDRALALAPEFAEGLLNRGNAHRALMRPDLAHEDYQRALALKPDYPEALLNVGHVQRDLRRPALAARSYARLLQVAPGFDYAAGLALNARLWCCDWSAYEEARQAILQAVQQGRRADLPLSLLALTDSAELQLTCARTYLAREKLAGAHDIPAGGGGGARLRVAYVSADFREHPVSYLMAGVFERHDRARVETIGVSLREPDASAIGARVRAAFEHHLDASRMSDAELVEALQTMGVDIAVDLMGHTDGARPGIFARRAAPVQVAYLGFPATTGAGFIDYLFADEFVIPPSARGFFAERVVELPGCFQANDDLRAHSGKPLTRETAGLPGSGFVFCSFNHPVKLNPPCFEAWMRLLSGVHRSVLWLLVDDAAAEANLRREAAARGVDPRRLVFARRVPYAQHLARLALADLFLDTFPFNAGTTASDALRAGLPVVTRAGEAFASRMAASLLRALGLPELVARDASEYERVALRLAREPQELAALRLRLAAGARSSTLYDSTRFCRALECGYEAMGARRRRGERPAPFAIPSGK